MADGTWSLLAAGIARASSGTDGLEYRQLEAARRWQHDWLLGAATVSDGEPISADQAADRHTAMLARVAASTRCRAVRRFLGERAERHLRLLLVETMSFSEVARLLMPGDIDGRKKVAAQASLLLDILASHYAASGALATD